MRFTLLTSLFIFIQGITFGQSISVFLIGDAGEPKLPNDPILQNLKEDVSNATEHDVLIFLGDNVYPAGIPSKEHPEREAMEEKLNASLDIIKGFKGKSFIIPGNHDWEKGKKHGCTVYQTK